MSASKKPMRYGHSEGHTDVCYDNSGQYILTCGSDGEVRMWQGIDDDPQSITVGERTRTVAVRNERIFTNSNNNAVQAHSFPKGSPDGIITRFTAPVNHFQLNASGDLLLAASDDFHIKLVTVEDSQQKVFVGHDAPILSVSLDPKEELIASSSCDSTIKVWKIQDQSCVKSWSLIPKCSDISISKTLCRISWQPDHGKHLAVPVDKSIQVYERDSWTLVCTLGDDRIKNPLSLTLWSKDGCYVIGVAVDGSIYVWQVNTKECVQFVQHDKKLTICGVALHPQGKNELAYTDTEGQLGLIENILPDSTSGSSTIKVSETDASQYADLFDDDDNDDDFLAAADAMEKIHESQNSQRSNQDKTANQMLNGGDDDDDDDDIGVLVSQKPKHRSLQRIQDDENSMDSTSKAASSVADDSDAEVSVAKKPVVIQGPTFTPLQQSFQSSSTPVHLSSRFMIWNSVGIIKAYNTDEENSIEVEFHDSSLHHAMHLDNGVGYTMAAMSTQAVVLAAESQDNDTPSQLLCLHFSSWDNQKEWSTTMPKGENIKAVTLGHGWLAAATDKRQIHLFTVGGFQWEIFSIPGPVVSMSGHGSQLIIVYHMAAGLPGDQCLGVKLLQVCGKQRQILSGDPLPINTKSTLTWLGFSAEGTPFSVDSDGVVRMLNRKLLSWCPVANTKSQTKGRSDHYWVVGVHESPLQLRCILCKGSTFPPTLPRPTIQILEFQIPLCEVNMEKGKYEEEYWRMRYFSNHFVYNKSQGYEIDEMAQKAAQDQLNNALMKLFALSCKTERDFRGGEIAEMMNSEHNISLAIKYASRMKKLSLAQYLSQLAQQRAEEEATNVMATEEEEDESYSYGNSLDAVYSHTETEWSSGQYKSQPDNNYDDDDEDTNMQHDSHDIERSPILKPKKITAPRLATSSQGRKNPFKLSGGREPSGSQTAKNSDTTRGSNVFDSLKKASQPTKHNIFKNVKGTKINKSQKIQPTLLQSRSKCKEGEKEKRSDVEEKDNKEPTPTKSVSAFQFWLQHNQDELRQDNPELDEEDILKLATQTWRKLSSDEKKQWLERAKGETAHVDDPTPQDKKRKREENTELLPSKKQSVISKLNKKESKAKVVLSSSTNTKLGGFAFQKE
ncbi:WD repeat and HMG-box DNA-binding protein 1-like [Glandiceps talaboti]